MAESGSVAKDASSVENCGNELTMLDVLEEEQELEEDAKAVLGDCDDKNCTYNVGYLSRQALYACATCCSETEPGGICLACSYACHEGHELFELYTKRNFRCDCGNKKFPNNRCHLCPNKDNENIDNKYNQNFQGKYCSCSRPYPDLDDDTPDVMIQCIICEDWYHSRHLGGEVPDRNYAEMICASCMDSHSFLYAYTPYSVSFKEDTNVVQSSLAAETLLENRNDSKISSNETTVEIVHSQDPEELIDIVSENKNNDKPCAAKCNLDNNSSCNLKKLSFSKIDMRSGPVFWSEGWRKKLCECQDCVLLHERKKCTFLLNESDTIHAYEERGKCRSGEESQYDKGLSALGSLDRVKQIEAIHEYNNMKGELKNYLRQFADNKQTVCKKDILDFFESMQKRKRQRIDTYVQPFCR